MDHDSLKPLILVSPVAVIGVDRSGTINIFNDAAVKMLGYTSMEMAGKTGIDVIYGSPARAREIKRLIHGPDNGGAGRLLDYETEIFTKSGKAVPIFLSAIIIEDKGKETGSVGFFQDFTKIKQLENKLREQSITDSLTGLYNHRHFHLKLEDEFQRSMRYNRKMSLACFDLDKFKKINDIMGHLDGDTILRLAGRVIGSLIRNTDYGFRYGGDEFMIIFPETNAGQARIIVDRIREHFNDEYPFEDRASFEDIPRVTLSIGISEIAGEDTIETIIKRADLAMYEAKNHGGDRIVTAAGSINAEER